MHRLAPNWPHIALIVFLSMVLGCAPPASLITPNVNQDPGSGTALASSSDRSNTALPSTCPTGPAVETAGARRLALVIGIGDYLSPRLSDLLGPPPDATRVYDLLTGPGGYGFPRENVCLLLDGEATSAGVKVAFEKALVDRAKAGDVIAIYFAGHGSQTRDLNGDEPDEWDETLVLQDSRVAGVTDLLDDDFHQMLTRLHDKSDNITVVLDSCNSGSASRDAGLRARFVDPETRTVVAPEGDTSGDEGEAFVPESLSGLVFVSGATDGTPAMEKDARGFFTSALLRTLGDAREPLTWAQVARRVPQLVAAESGQIPHFQGDLARVALGSERRTHILGWDVLSVQDDRVELAVVPLPGWGVGAELRVYGGAITGLRTQDPSQAKATLEVLTVGGLRATARMTSVPERGVLVEPGDHTVLVRPGEDALKISVRLRPESEPGGVIDARADAILKALATRVEVAPLVQIVTKGASFELATRSDGRLILYGPEGNVRIAYPLDPVGEAKAVVTNLWQHARTQALLQITGEGGEVFVDNQTLRVRLVPTSRQSRCAQGRWIQALPFEEQILPLCHRWVVEVELSAASPFPLLVGGLALSSDGSILGFPQRGDLVRLEPGKVWRFEGDSFGSTPPLNVRDHLLIFGTQEDNPVRWSDYSDVVPVDQSARSISSLGRALDRYFTPPSLRGITRIEGVSTTAWTLSHIAVRVEANTRLIAGAESGPVTSREYTLPNFDLRPYMPDDSSSPLARVLGQAQTLTLQSGGDGIPYKQHDWSAPSDAENLKRGIDCSRAIWYAFTRAGLPYSDGGHYLPTATMAKPNGPMATNFESCLGDPALRIGDVLVYRDTGRDVGHTVMVIDAKQRIAWGSHGWDGNIRELEKGMPVVVDTGVEYQIIKYKQDWTRWDRSTMQRVACWRHREIGRGASGGGLPGTLALTNVCDERKACGGGGTTSPGGNSTP